MLIFSPEMLLRLGANELSMKVEVKDQLLNLIFEGLNGEVYVETFPSPIYNLPSFTREALDNILYRVILTHKRLGA
jgi:hypothetical protein